MLPVRPADVLFAMWEDSAGVQLRWAHRLNAYVPMRSTFAFQKTDY
jgi:hypothetical protein